MKQAAKESAADQSLGALKSIRDISFFLGIYFLFSGWIYIYYYLNFFGISVREAGIDYSQFGIYSYNVISFYAGTVMFWILIASCIILFYALSGFYERISKKNKLILVVLALCFFFPFVFRFSARAGTHEAYNQSTTGLKKVKFIFNEAYLKGDSTVLLKDPDHAYERGRIIQVNEDEHLRLILSTSDRYFALEYDTCVSCVRNIYCIKKENIDNVIIFAEHTIKDL